MIWALPVCEDDVDPPILARVVGVIIGALAIEGGRIDRDDDVRIGRRVGAVIVTL